MLRGPLSQWSAFLAAIFAGLIVGFFVGRRDAGNSDPVAISDGIAKDVGTILERVNALATRLQALETASEARPDMAPDRAPDSGNSIEVQLKRLIERINDVDAGIREALGNGAGAGALAAVSKKSDPETIRAVGARVTNDVDAVLQEVYLQTAWRVLQAYGKPSSVSSTASVMTWQYDTQTEYSLFIDFQSGLVTGISYRQR